MARSSRNLGFLEVPVEIQPPPFSPWLRLGIFDNAPKRPWTHVCYLDDFAFHLQIEGESWVWLEMLGGAMNVVPGDLIFFPPGVVYGWRYDGREVHLAVHFDLHAKPEVPAFFDIHTLRANARNIPVSRTPMFVLSPTGGAQQGYLHIPMITHLRQPDVWRDRLELLVQLHQTHEDVSIEAQCVIQETITWALTTLHRGDDANKGVDSHIDAGIEAILHQMKDPQTREDLHKMSVEQMARRAGKGLTTFRDAFKKATGRSPHQYLVERQMEQAAHMLVSTDDRIREIALAVGYEDPYHFSRLFHQVMGTSPTDYRTQSRNASLDAEKNRRDL